MNRKVTSSRRVWIYGALTLVLVVTYSLLHAVQWRGSTELHTIMEVIATLAALTVGSMALVRFYSKKNNVYLLIGVGFFGTALLDGYHTLVTSSFFHELLPSPPPSLIPWSWNASRTFLAVLMCLSWWVWRWERRLSTRRQIKEVTVYLAVAASTLICFLFFAFVPLPRAYYPEFIFGRPEEFVAATFFAIALFGYLTKGRWREDALEHWIVLSLILGLFSQAVVMSRSYMLFDAMFDLAHLLKILSYGCVLVGFLINMFYLFRRAESSADELITLNEALEKRVAERTETLQNEVAERKQVEEKLHQKVSQLERFNRLTQGRELRIIEMKREVNEMARKAGVAPPYKSSGELPADSGHLGTTRGADAYRAVAMLRHVCDSPSQT